MMRGFHQIGLTFPLENPAVLLFSVFQFLSERMPKRGKCAGITEIMPNRIEERAMVSVHVLALRCRIQDYVRLLLITSRKCRGR